MNAKENAQKYIDQHAETYLHVSHEIWKNPELSLKEYKAAALYKDELRAAGFTVTENIAGIETAFSGSYGNGKPVIGILGEFDALSGVGHGCGHNMLGAGAFGAACAVKNYLETTGNTGTVIFYGCPGEEGGASKAFMAREGLWKSLDCAISWHPGDKNKVNTGTCNSCIQVLYKFHGKASHAAGAPEMGRSALDAVELMNTGVQYLREHMKSDCRIHYAVTNSGGISPNVVQAEASVLYMVRAVAVKDSVELQARVDKIAEGAALMTETTYDRIFVDGTANMVPNEPLENLLYENMKEVPLPEYTAEELAFAEEIRKTYMEDAPVPAAGNAAPEAGEGSPEASSEGSVTPRACPLSRSVEPHKTADTFEAGSTDVGDVCWLTPAAYFNAVCWPKDAPGHSWQNTRCGGSSIGDKGLLYAAKVLACSAVDLFQKPDMIRAAKEEFQKRTASGYVCPIPQGVKPYIIEE